MQKNYTQITLSGTGDSHPTAAYLWRPAREPRAVLQIVHGMSEHMARYADFASFLVAQGYAVCGHDHMGHGKSRREMDAFGYFGETDGPRRLVKECHRVTRLIQREYPCTPIFLLGHSMGSFVGRLYLLYYAAEITGFLCMGTSGEIPLASVGRVLTEAVIRLRGPQTEGRALNMLAFANYTRRFSLESSKMCWLSRDPQVVEAFERDPLIRPYFTNAGYRDLHQLQAAACGKGWAKRVDKSLPILLVSGSEDPVGNYGKGIVQVYERLKMAGVFDVEYKLYEGARHELLNELNREEVYYDLYRWMETRLR